MWDKPKSRTLLGSLPYTWLVSSLHSSHHPQICQGLLLGGGTQACFIFSTREVVGSEVGSSQLRVNLLPKLPSRNIKPSRRHTIIPGGHQPNLTRCRIVPGSCQTSNSPESRCHRTAFGSAATSQWASCTLILQHHHDQPPRSTLDTTTCSPLSHSTMGQNICLNYLGAPPFISLPTQPQVAAPAGILGMLSTHTPPGLQSEPGPVQATVTHPCNRPV